MPESAQADALRIGVDLGGTKIEAALVRDSGEIVQRIRRPTPKGSYGQTVAAIVGLVADLKNASASMDLTIGMCTPGAISPETGLIKNANSTWLNGRSLKQDCESALGRPVRMANDADCLAVSEQRDGAAQAQQNVFAVILGTGVGGGITINGGLLQGANAIAGEWGHIPLPGIQREAGYESQVCWCGQRDCIETWLSGPALLGQYQKLAENKAASAENVQEIVQKATAGETLAKNCLEIYCQRLARALALIINVIDPQTIVLGGGLSNIGLLYQRVPAIWAEWVFSDVVNTTLIAAQHGGSSGVRGAAWLWRD